MNRDRRVCLGTLLVVGALAGAGCGSGGSRHSATRTQSGAGRSATTPSRRERGRPAPASAVRVIRAWSEALRNGHILAAARYWHLPAIYYDGGDPPQDLHTFAQIEAVNESLPCGAELISARIVGDYVNALFRLTLRAGPGGDGCGTSIGLTARTNFIIRGGRIVTWLRAPDQPGDNQPGPQSPSQTHTTPSIPLSPGTRTGPSPIA
jgi:hypothetical protein